MLLFASPSFCHQRFLCLCLIFLVFSVVYLVACDDPVDFGGVSVAQDALRTEAAEQGAEQRLDRTPPSRVPSEAFVVNAPAAVASDIRQDVGTRERRELRYVKYSWARWFNMLYFSMSNTITMGYGDIYPLSTRAKVLVVGQMLCLFLVLCLQSA